jgi:DnaJ-class molecular chaperone
MSDMCAPCEGTGWTDDMRMCQWCQGHGRRTALVLSGHCADYREDSKGDGTEAGERIARSNAMRRRARGRHQRRRER